MNHIITTMEKKNFLQWFLNRYELQNRESAWLITYIMSDEKLLENVHFVDDSTSTKRTILMSTKCVKGISFRFTKGKLVTSDVERAFHDIRLNPDEVESGYHQHVSAIYQIGCRTKVEYG